MDDSRREDAWIYESDQQVKVGNVSSPHRAFRSPWQWPSGGLLQSVCRDPVYLFVRMPWFTPAVLASHLPSTFRDKESYGYSVSGKFREPIGRAQHLGALKVLKKLFFKTLCHKHQLSIVKKMGLRQQTCKRLQPKIVLKARVDCSSYTLFGLGPT